MCGFIGFSVNEDDNTDLLNKNLINFIRNAA